jgi:hypothetical protein
MKKVSKEHTDPKSAHSPPQSTLSKRRKIDFFQKSFRSKKAPNSGRHQPLTLNTQNHFHHKRGLESEELNYPSGTLSTPRPKSNQDQKGETPHQWWHSSVMNIFKSFMTGTSSPSPPWAQNPPSESAPNVPQKPAGGQCTRSEVKELIHRVSFSSYRFWMHLVINNNIHFFKKKPTGHTQPVSHSTRNAHLESMGMGPGIPMQSTNSGISLNEGPKNQPRAVPNNESVVSFSSLTSNASSMSGETMDYGKPPPPASAALAFLSRYTLDPVFLSRYQLEFELGQGGFGFVLGGRRRHDGEPVAIKFILKKKVPQGGWALHPTLGRVPLEVYILSQCHHSNIISFLDYVSFFSSYSFLGNSS